MEKELGCLYLQLHIIAGKVTKKEKKKGRTKLTLALATFLQYQNSKIVNVGQVTSIT